MSATDASLRPRRQVLVGTAHAVWGALFVPPFFLLNAIVVSRFEPVFSWIRPGAHTSALEVVLLFGSIGLFLVGAAVALAPAGWRTECGRAVPIANLAVAVILVAGFLALFGGVGAEVIACDVLGIPNCD